MRNEHYQSCLEACHECIVACENCAAECLHEEEVKMLARCIELDRSCADICAVASREMARNSDFAERLCVLCVEVCQACGDECARHPMDHCQACAKACYHCAEECREMAGSMAA